MTERRGGPLLWTGYAVAFLIGQFFYAGIFARFPLMGSVPVLLPAAVAIVAVLEGSTAGSVFGLCAGLFVCLAPGQAGAGMILLGALLGMLCGFAAQRRLRRPFWPCMLEVLVSLFLTELVRTGWELYSGAGSFGVLCRIAGWELVYSLLLAVPLYPLFRFVHQKLGTY